MNDREINLSEWRACDDRSQRSAASGSEGHTVRELRAGSWARSNLDCEMQSSLEVSRLIARSTEIRVFSRLPKTWLYRLHPSLLDAIKALEVSPGRRPST